MTTSNRIIVVDALRGFALFGILMLHALEHFDLLIYPESNGVFEVSDKIINDVLFFLFAGKAYSIFAIMFGFSFYIQMSNNASRGKDFSLGFLWRLIILLVMGYLHSLMYIGDVLVVFALLGLPLILFYKINYKYLLIIAVLCIFQVPNIYFFIQSLLDANYTYQEDWHHWANVFKTLSEGSFKDVISMNAKESYLAKWQFYYNSGRYIQMFGLIVLGLIIGKLNYFKNLKQHQSKTVIVLAISMLLLIVCLVFPTKSVGLNELQIMLLEKLTTSYGNFFLTIVWMSGFILLYNRFASNTKQSLLSTYGRMSLTNYVSQAVIGGLFFYGYGLGMYQYFGQTQCLFYGVVFFILQIFISKYWFKKYYYGPLEWLWRALTFWDFNLRFKRK